MFIDPEKLTDEDIRIYADQGILIRGYQDIFDYVAHLPENSSVCITSNKINYRLWQTIPASCRIADIPSTVDLMKRIKN